MSKKIRLGQVAVLCLGLLLGNVATAFGGDPQPPKAAAPAKETPGVELARTLSTVTGVAISPLLGVGAVGAYQYWRAEPSRRAALPWYAQPWFWIPALLLVGIVALKDILGTTAPGVLKKPFDVAEAIENKVSALVAAGAFLPMIVSMVPEAQQSGPLPGPGAMSSTLFVAAADGGTLAYVLGLVFALTVFALVWLTFNTVNVLILMSPFATVDAALKASRFFVLLLVVGLSFLSPYLGALFCLLLVFVCYLLAGWSFRLTVFGAIFVWDLVTVSNKRFNLERKGARIFTAARIGTAPVRSYGRLERLESGGLRFSYRPWLIFPRKAVELPAGSYWVGRGIMYPEIFQETQGRTATVFVLPPRYRAHEGRLAELFGFAGVRDIGLLKGWRTIRAWIGSCLGRPALEPA